MKNFFIIFSIIIFSCSNRTQDVDIKSKDEELNKTVDSNQTDEPKFFEEELSSKKVLSDSVEDIDYYLSNSLGYAPFINLSFIQPELIEKIKNDINFKDKLIKKFNSYENELDYYKGFSTVKSQVSFFEIQLKLLQCCKEEQKTLLGIIPSVEPENYTTEDYVTLFSGLTRADGAAHWEIANTIFTLIIIDGDKVLAATNNNKKAQEGYKEWVEKIDEYCFVAMSDDNVPKIIIERKINYLLGKIDKDKYPEFYKKLKASNIRVID